MEIQKKHIAILGSTGSIGKQTLEIIAAFPEYFVVEVLTANKNADLLIEQALKYKPGSVVIAGKEHYPKIEKALWSRGIKVFAGKDSLEQILESDTIDIVLNALVGFSGFLPTCSAIKNGKAVALANKESLVVGGALIKEMQRTHKSRIIPVDSEHSAILQCLIGEELNPVKKVILTASGGPFRNYTQGSLKTVTPEQALQHPKWNMGNKITIDSATMMNKGFEVIEAKWLFDLQADQIEVIIHPQSIIHSMVQFGDGALKAQLGLPDMKTAIQYALFFPLRMKSESREFHFAEHAELTFEPPDLKIFRNLALAYEAMNEGGNIPCAMNAANEIAVEAFLNKKIGFLEISGIIEKCIKKINKTAHPTLDDYISTNQEARKLAWSYL